MIRRTLDLDEPETTACESDVVVIDADDDGTRLLFARGRVGDRRVAGELKLCGKREALLLAARIARLFA